MDHIPLFDLLKTWITECSVNISCDKDADKFCNHFFFGFQYCFLNSILYSCFVWCMYTIFYHTITIFSYVVWPKGWKRFEKSSSSFPCYFLFFFIKKKFIKYGKHSLVLALIFKYVKHGIFKLLITGIYCTHKYLELSSHHQNKILVKIIHFLPNTCRTHEFSLF